MCTNNPLFYRATKRQSVRRVPRGENEENKVLRKKFPHWQSHWSQKPSSLGCKSSGDLKGINKLEIFHYARTKEDINGDKLAFLQHAISSFINMMALSPIKYQNLSCHHQVRFKISPLPQLRKCHIVQAVQLYVHRRITKASKSFPMTVSRPQTQKNPPQPKILNSNPIRLDPPMAAP